jgi:ABC-type multidrug transport system ATPase subunit
MHAVRRHDPRQHRHRQSGRGRRRGDRRASARWSTNTSSICRTAAPADRRGGRRLSGGLRQRQHRACATFLGAPPVLLLDEPTSDLDNDAERELAQTLREMARESTIIAVTHSPALLGACDSILVLEGGKVAMAGPVREVLQRLQKKPEIVQPLRSGKPA